MIGGLIDVGVFCALVYWLHADPLVTGIILILITLNQILDYVRK